MNRRNFFASLCALCASCLGLRRVMLSKRGMMPETEIIESRVNKLTDSELREAAFRLCRTPTRMFECKRYYSYRGLVVTSVIGYSFVDGNGIRHSIKS